MPPAAPAARPVRDRPAPAGDPPPAAVRSNSAARPDPAVRPGPAVRPDPAVVAAHPDWEWATPERLAELTPKPRPAGEPVDLGVWEGTFFGELMRNPLPAPEGGFLSREAANEDPRRDRGPVPAAAGRRGE